MKVMQQKIDFKSTNASEIQQEVLFNKLFISRASKLAPANKIVLLHITSSTAGESTAP